MGLVECTISLVTSHHMEESKSGELQHVKARILELEAEIKEAKDEAKKAGNNDKKERDYWRSKEAQLRDELNVLLKKEERLEVEAVRAKIKKVEGEIEKTEGDAETTNDEETKRRLWKKAEQLQDRLNVLLKKEERLEGASAAPAAALSLEQLREVIRSEFERNAAPIYGEARYTSSRRTGFTEDMKREWGSKKCVVLGDKYSGEVRAAHIFPARHYYRAGEAGLTQEDVWSPRNGLWLARRIEEAFDDMRICIIPVNPLEDNSPLKLHILDPKLLLPGSFLYLVAGKCDDNTPRVLWSDLQDRELTLPDGHRPFHRALSFHMEHSLRHAVTEGWMDEATSDGFSVFAQLSFTAEARGERTGSTTS